jgi:hypothetical protein
MVVNHPYGYENFLGFPSINGQILSSTTTGIRSWIPQNTTSIEQGFDIGDWILSGNNYELSIVHNLNTLIPVSNIVNNSQIIMVNEITIIDENTIKLSVPMVPDLRFSGSIGILKS